MFVATGLEKLVLLAMNACGLNEALVMFVSTLAMVSRTPCFDTTPVGDTLFPVTENLEEAKDSFATTLALPEIIASGVTLPDCTENFVTIP